jgi:hypothetical protein
MHFPNGFRPILRMNSGLASLLAVLTLPAVKVELLLKLCDFANNLRERFPNVSLDVVTRVNLLNGSDR